MKTDLLKTDLLKINYSIFLSRRPCALASKIWSHNDLIHFHIRIQIQIQIDDLYAAKKSTPA